MLLFETEMHVVTFIFVVLEITMFFYQFTYYLSRPEDKNRMWYLILLFLLIIYNITGGLFPDSKMPLPIILQNILAYGSGFLTAAYFPYYFYKGFHLKKIRFHAVYGVFYFLLLPYLIFFVIVYSINNNLDFAIRYGIIIPFFYSLVLLWAIQRAIRSKYKQDQASHNSWEVIAVYLALIPWVSLTVITYFKLGQLIEAICTNGGLVVITILFIHRNIKNAKLEYKQLLEFNTIGKRLPDLKLNCKHYQLTSREVEIMHLIRDGYKHKMIAEALFISEKTVRKHVQNIYTKVEATNKVEAINKLEQNIQTTPNLSLN